MGNRIESCNSVRRGCSNVDVTVAGSELNKAVKAANK